MAIPKHSVLLRHANSALSIPYVAPKGELETLLAKLFAEALTLDHVGADDDFLELGGDLLLGEALCTLISQRLGFDFQMSLLFEHGSPRRLCALLTSRAFALKYHSPLVGDRPAEVEILCLQPGNENTPIYCTPDISGSVSWYIDLAKMLRGDRPVYGIRIANDAQTEKLGAFASLRGMAASMAAKLLTDHPDGPICLLGHSFGGHLAIELARQLVEQGKVVPFVGMIDTMPGPACFTPAHRIYHFARNVGPWALKVAAGGIADAKRWLNFRNTILRKLRGQHKLHPHNFYKNLPESRKNIVDQNLINSRTYRFEGIYPGTIFLFRPRVSAVPLEHLFRPNQLEDYGWRHVTRANVRVVYIPGDHTSCLLQPDVMCLASELSLALEAANSGSEDIRQPA